ncbi:MAG: hypothetical protein M3457_08145 [Chloroflexota bacterium]|nr:hypothetical protein [Chloroflexota bacterium]
MRRFFLPLAFAFVLVSGVVVTAAQTSNEAQTEEEDSGAQGAGCASPVASPSASPEASPSLALASTPAGSVSLDASPVALEVCATPDLGTPAS